MSDLVSQNLNMIFKTPKGETVHALKDVNFYFKKRRTFNSSWPFWMWKNYFT
jgi:ABC-type oligopeptide transport system ATPase subunit